MADRIVYYDGCFVNYFDHETGVAVVAVKKVISARSQARGLANNWPMCEGTAPSVPRSPGSTCDRGS